MGFDMSPPNTNGTAGTRGLAIGLVDWFLRLIIGALAVTVLTLWRDVALLQENRFTENDGLRMERQVEEFCRELIVEHEKEGH